MKKGVKKLKRMFILNVQIKLEKNVKSMIFVEAVVRKCSSKVMFLKILQVSQENTCAGVSF